MNAFEEDDYTREQKTNILIMMMMTVTCSYG